MGKIKVSYLACDGAKTNKTFGSIEAARTFAHQWVGEHPEIGSTYAVSGDGIGQIMVKGCILAELFPPRNELTPVQTAAADEAALDAYSRRLIAEAAAVYQSYSDYLETNELDLPKDM